MFVYGWIGKEDLFPGRITLSQNLSADNKTHYSEENGLSLTSTPREAPETRKSQTGGLNMDPELQRLVLLPLTRLHVFKISCSRESGIQRDIEREGQRRLPRLLLHSSHVNNESRREKIHTRLFLCRSFRCVMKTNGDVAAAAATPHSGLIHPHLNEMYSPSQVEDAALPQPPSLQLHLQTELGLLNVFKSTDMRNFVLKLVETPNHLG